MTLQTEREYNLNIQNGKNILNKAEELYELKNLEDAIQAYYRASICFETAKEIAKLSADCSLTIKAKDLEFYCLEKIDELQTFKNVDLNEVIR